MHEKCAAVQSVQRIPCRIFLRSQAGILAYHHVLSSLHKIMKSTLSVARLLLRSDSPLCSAANAQIRNKFQLARQESGKGH
jgi:hypothetical protein